MVNNNSDWKESSSECHWWGTRAQLVNFDSGSECVKTDHGEWYYFVTMSRSEAEDEYNRFYALYTRVVCNSKSSFLAAADDNGEVKVCLLSFWLLMNISIPWVYGSGASN
ncbi:hypothetical protein LR48_Vigan01g044800 [Vigna angularis]|uniref:Uncharacterized protein n=1 Tax=Phaseolus angularis TaxID=3914 RepID=A0A0L9TJU7_PHAAN|nr:hypothetical protein LR48_Vigan01g044800 [Vigna angularis]